MTQAARTSRPFALAAVGVALSLVLLAACGGSSSAPGASSNKVPHRSGGHVFQAAAVNPPTERPDFTLTDTKGQPYDFRQRTDGKVTLLYFGYTHCPDVCPINMAQIKAALATGALGNVTVVFVTVDPARDTPTRLRSWLNTFDPSFVGLVGTQAQIQAAEKAAGVPLAVKQGSGPDYTVGHAAQVLTYAPDNKGYVQFPFGTRQSAIVHDLEVLESIPPASAPPQNAARAAAASAGSPGTPE